MKIISTLFYATFITLLLGVAGLFLASMLPIPGNIQIKIVKSGSMEPTILTGSIVIVKPQTAIAKNDIITFGEDNRREIPTTHRVIEVTSENGRVAYATKGDANEEADPQLVPDTLVIGKVVLSVPYVGYILDFARKPIGFTLMIGIPAGLIILDELTNIVREVFRIKRRKVTTRTPDLGSSYGIPNRDFDMSGVRLHQFSDDQPRNTI